MKRASQAVVAAAKTPWVAWPVGLALVAFSGLMLYRVPPADKLHMGFWGGLMLLGVGILPGVLPFFAKNVAPVVALWKNRNGSAGPPSGPSSP